MAENDFLSSGIDFEGAQRRGRALGRKPGPDSILPEFARGSSGKERLLNVLLGLTPGQQAAQQSVALGDPLGAFVAGFGAQAGAPTAAGIAQQRQSQALQFQMQQLEATPIEQVSPALAEKFPELVGLPTGLINRIAPALQRSEALEQQLAIALGNERGRNVRAGSARTSKRIKEIENKLFGTKGIVNKALDPEEAEFLRGELVRLRGEDQSDTPTKNLKALTSPEAVREAFKNDLISREEARNRIQELRSR